MEMMIGVLVTILLGAFALSAVDWLVACWVSLYTWPLSPEIRDRRREEINRDVLDQRSEEAKAGYRPVEIAVRIALRCVLGVPADLSWCAGRWLSLRRRRREAKDGSSRPEGPTRTQMLVTAVGQAHPDVSMRIIRSSAFPGAYWVEDPPPAGGAGMIMSAADQMRRAAIFTQQMGMWGDESVVPSAPAAPRPTLVTFDANIYDEVIVTTGMVNDLARLAAAGELKVLTTHVQ